MWSASFPLLSPCLLQLMPGILAMLNAALLQPEAKDALSKLLFVKAFCPSSSQVPNSFNVCLLEV